MDKYPNDLPGSHDAIWGLRDYALNLYGWDYPYWKIRRLPDRYPENKNSVYRHVLRLQSKDGEIKFTYELDHSISILESEHGIEVKSNIKNRSYADCLQTIISFQENVWNTHTSIWQPLDGTEEEKAEISRRQIEWNREDGIL